MKNNFRHLDSIYCEDIYDVADEVFGCINKHGYTDVSVVVNSSELMQIISSFYSFYDVFTDSIIIDCYAGDDNETYCINVFQSTNSEWCINVHPLHKIKSWRGQEDMVFLMENISSTIAYMLQSKKFSCMLICLSDDDYEDEDEFDDKFEQCKHCEDREKCGNTTDTKQDVPTETVSDKDKETQTSDIIVDNLTARAFFDVLWRLKEKELADWLRIGEKLIG